MNKFMLIGTLLGAVGITATGTMAGYQLLDKGPEYAEVLNVQPVTETIRTPREECHQEVITHQSPTKDSKQIAGTMIGAVVGGILGNQVGGGKGKKLATLAAAAAGGYAGNKVQKEMQAKDTYTTTEERCETLIDSEERVIGYDVEYRLEDQVTTVRMAQQPGERIPVENGQLMLSRAEEAQEAL